LISKPKAITVILYYLIVTLNGFAYFSVSDESGKIKCDELKTGGISKGDLGSDVSYDVIFDITNHFLLP